MNSFEHAHEILFLFLAARQQQKPVVCAFTI
jgi:hypothetical protein